MYTPAANARQAPLRTDQGPVLTIENVSHRYGPTLALDRIGFRLERAQIFGLLGPNGGGKTTLCRIISTQMRPSVGTVSLLGADVWKQPHRQRHRFGVVFQHPSLDPEFTVIECLRFQGRLYGLSGDDLDDRIARVLVNLRLAERRHHRVATLSGGLRRRVEVAKAFLHQPEFLLLDEPSTGLDPGARIDLWDTVSHLRRDYGVSVLVTTHLIDEADRCDCVGILHRGRMVALGRPADLKAEIGNHVITAATPDPTSVAQQIATRFNVEVYVLDEKIRIGVDAGHDFAAHLVREFERDILSIMVGQPTLEDVFIARTGLRFGDEEGDEESLS